jgi:uncharacterized membrane protein
MSGAEGSQIEFRTDRVSSRQLVSQAWRILWPEYFWIALAICLVGLVVGSAAPMAVLMGPMMCGIFICCFAMMRNERPTFDMLFKGFDMFVDSLVATLIMVGVSFLVMIPVGVLMVGGLFAVGLVGEQAGDGAFGGIMIFFMFGYVVAILVIVVIQMLFVFSYPLIVDYNLSGVDAVKLSARAAWANLGNILRLSILIWLMSICAVILCYLPILLVIPINLLTQALLYRRVFPDHSTDSQQYDPYADPYADPQADPHVNPHADVGGYQLDEGVSETGPGAESGGDTWE